MSLEAMDAFFNKRADTYDDHMLVEMQLNEFYEAIAGCFPESDKALSLLDLGCGTGLELERLFERMPNLNVTGIDLSKEMLSLLQQPFLCPFSLAFQRYHQMHLRIKSTLQLENN